MRHLIGHLSCWPEFMEELIVVLVVILVILVAVKRK